MTDEERRAWVDKASIRDLLEKVRFEPPGSLWFSNRTGIGEYLKARLNKLRAQDPGAYVAASKSLG